MFPPLSLPTPVVACATFQQGSAHLWLKDDGHSHPLYGGNKARKLALIVREAERRGAKRIITFGAAGSHHVLSTALFARGHGFEAAAVLTPQPSSPHVIETLRASHARGVEILPSHPAFELPFVFLRAYRRFDYVVPPGGSNAMGASAYIDAVEELKGQISAGLLPEPDVIVTPLGSGGTCAGLLAGVVHHGLRSRVRGVQVVTNPLARLMVVSLARNALSRRGVQIGSGELGARLDVDRSQIGVGYGRATPAALRALDRAREALALELDVTYTAKAFAAVLEILAQASASPTPQHVLYWHTLSRAPVAPLLEGAPPFDELPTAIRALVR